MVDYNKQAEKWHRDEPKHYSDFCGIPEVYDLAKKFGSGRSFLDLGCGEGYFCRRMVGIAKDIVGVDTSTGMIDLAVKKEEKELSGINYHISDVRNMPFINSAQVDLCIGNYVANYFRPDELPQFYSEIARVLKAGGKFVLLIPHPVLRLCIDYGEAIKYQIDDFDYVKSRGKWYDGVIKTIQGDFLEIGLYHSTIEDHFNAISHAKLKISQIKEPVFPYDVAQRLPLFSKMVDKIDCMIFIGEK